MNPSWILEHPCCWTAIRRWGMRRIWRLRGWTKREALAQKRKDLEDLRRPGRFSRLTAHDSMEYRLVLRGDPDEHIIASHPLALLDTLEDVLRLAGLIGGHEAEQLSEKPQPTNPPTTGLHADRNRPASGSPRKRRGARGT